MSAEHRITQSLNRKHQWIEWVTSANETWIVFCASQIPSEKQLAPLWTQASV
jgi:hypothetical protein